MKALSLRQPYAELIVSGKKTIEIRPWNTNFRGEFLIHAAKRVFWDDCNRFGLSSVETGKVVGKAILIDVKKYSNISEFSLDKDKHLAGETWFRGKCYGFLLEGASRVEGRECKGWLGFFNV